MELINNTALTIRKSSAFCHWVIETAEKLEIGIDQSAEEITTLLENNFSCYLVPILADENAVTDYINTHFLEIAECELAQWCFDCSCWPKISTVNDFNRWFIVEAHSSVVGI